MTGCSRGCCPTLSTCTAQLPVFPLISTPVHLLPNTRMPAPPAPRSPQVSSTCDPFWHQLVQQVEGADTQPASNAACSGWPYEAAFAPEVLDRHVAALPAFVLTGGAMWRREGPRQVPPP